MGIKPKAIARIGSRSVLIPFPTKGETPLAPPIPVAPHEPTGVTASAGIFTVDVALSWTDASNNEDGFYVYRNTSNTTTGATLIKTLGAGVQSYTDNAANSGANAPAEGATYFYWVSSFNAGGESAKSPAASNALGGETTIWLVPTAPSSLSATAVSSSQINLSWTDNSNNETGFEIFRSTDGITFSSIATVGAGVTTYNNTGLSASTQYYYKVWAYNPGENSTYSNTANATTQAAAGVPTPTFEVNFTTDPYVGTRFSRASRGTFVNSSGFIQAAEMNTLQQSQEFDNVYWGKTGLLAFGSGSTANADTAPDGSTTADLITESSGGTTGHAVTRTVGTLTANTSYTLSVFMKKPASNGRNFGSFVISAAGGNRAARTVNLTDGTITSYIQGTGFASQASGSENMGNGWWRVWVRVTVAGAAATNTDVYFTTASVASPTYFAGSYPDHAGDGVSGILLWGAQFVEGTSMLPYVRTTTASNGTPRITHDPVTLAPLGLLMEAQATNRAPNSILLDANYTLSGGVARTTQNAISTPRGASVSASKITGSALGGATSAFYYTENLLGIGNYTLSIYAKADGANFLYLFIADGAADHGRYFDLSNGTMGNTTGTPTSSSITNAGNGWYRCAVSVNNTSGATHYPALLPSTTNATGRASQAGTSPNGILVTAIQFEAAAFPSSWIETTSTTAVTRSGDIYGFFATEVASFWNASAGSVAMNWQRAGREAQTPVAKFGFAVSGNQYMRLNMSGGASPSIANGGSNTVSTVTGHTTTPNIGVPMKSGFSYDSAPNFKGFVNGTAGTNITSVSLPTVNKIEFATQVGDFMQSGYTVAAFGDLVIGRLRYWNTKLSDADMQTATT